MIVILNERPDGRIGLLQAGECVHRENLLVQRSMEAFDNPVALRASHVGLRHAEPQEGHLVHEVRRVVLRAVIGPQLQLQVGAHPLLNAAELQPYRLAHRLHRREPVPPLGRVPAEDFVVKMLNNPKEPAPAIPPREELLPIRGPHPVGGHGGDRPIVAAFSSIPDWPAGAQQAVLPHQPVHPVLGDSVPPPRQLPGDLLVALAVKRAPLDFLPDQLKRPGIPNCRPGAGPLPRITVSPGVPCAGAVADNL